MWLYGDLLAAAADTPEQASGASDQLIIMIGGVITAAIVALGGVMVAMVNRGSNKTTPSPPAPVSASSDHVLYERTAVLARRADDSDERFDMIDKARATDRDDLDDVLDYLDAKDPDWRR